VEQQVARGSGRPSRPSRPQLQISSISCEPPGAGLSSGVSAGTRSAPDFDAVEDIGAGPSSNRPVSIRLHKRAACDAKAHLAPKDCFVFALPLPDRAAPYGFYPAVLQSAVHGSPVLRYPSIAIALQIGHTKDRPCPVPWKADEGPEIAISTPMTRFRHCGRRALYSRAGGQDRDLPYVYATTDRGAVSTSRTRRPASAPNGRRPLVL